MSAAARECWGWNTPRDKANRRYPHVLRRRLLGMDDGGVELPPGGGGVLW